MMSSGISDTSQKSLSSDDDNSGSPPSLTTDSSKTASTKGFRQDAKSHANNQTSINSSDDTKLPSDLGASESGGSSGSENGSIEDAKLLSDLGASKSGSSYNGTSEDAKLPSDLGASESGGSENGNPLSFGFDFDDACCFSKGSPGGSDGSGSRNSGKSDISSSRNIDTPPVSDLKPPSHTKTNQNTNQASGSVLRRAQNDNITVVTSTTSSTSNSCNQNNSTSASSSAEINPSAVTNPRKSLDSAQKSTSKKLSSNKGKGVKRKAPPMTKKSREVKIDDDDYFDDEDDYEDDSVRATCGKTNYNGQGGDHSKREDRNMREKERSFQISKQICNLRELLSAGGVIVPKGTKSSVLTEAASYIRMLQQHQYRSEIERQQLVQQIRMIGKGALGPQAAVAIRNTAAKNGIWPLGNFGGVPPLSAMTAPPSPSSNSSADDSYDYKGVFSTNAVAMAIASMGGTFVDCNKLFLMKAGYTKQELCALTIFNLTQRVDLQTAFEQISNMISPPNEGQPGATSTPCILRGTFKNQSNISLSVSLIRGNDGIAKCFCVTLQEHRARPKASKFGGIPMSLSNSDQGQELLATSKPNHNGFTEPTYASG